MKNWGKTALNILFGVLVGLLAAGLVLLVSSPPRGAAIALLPPPTPSPILIHVSGAVSQPGVYTLSAGSRVLDAIQAAGGLLPEADQRNLNLAALVEDGSRVQVPSLPPVLPSAAAGESRSAIIPTEAPQAQSVYPININTATQADLESLPGIGPVTAAKIIEYREKNGPFKTIEELMDVPGIGPKTFEELKDLITV